ncbi:hypothetical protein BH11PLA2_BH11PLA2_06220 [soil metagenome]
MKTESLHSHLQVKRYGAFTLTDAVRPAPNAGVTPREGYRVKVYRDRGLSLRLPMMTAAVSAEHLFDAFLALLEPLGDELHVVLESSHDTGKDKHTDYRRNNIDAPVLLSHFCDYESLLLNDGCTGVAVLCSTIPMEVQFDEHKLLSVYAPDLTRFENALRGFGIERRKLLPVISEGEHLHHSTEGQADQFQELCLKIGVGDEGHVFSDEQDEAW